MRTDGKPRFDGVKAAEVIIENSPVGIQLKAKFVFVDGSNRSYGIAHPKGEDLRTAKIKELSTKLMEEVEKVALKSLFHVSENENENVKEGGLHHELPRGIADEAEEVEQF